MVRLDLFEPIRQILERFWSSDIVYCDVVPEKKEQNKRREDGEAKKKVDLKCRKMECEAREPEIRKVSTTPWKQPGIELKACQEPSKLRQNGGKCRMHDQEMRKGNDAVETAGQQCTYDRSFSHEKTRNKHHTPALCISLSQIEKLRSKIQSLADAQ